MEFRRQFQTNPSVKLIVCQLVCLAVMVSAPLTCRAADDAFRGRVAPFVKTYCSECHNATRKEAELNLVRYESSESLADDFRQWEHVITFVERDEMPPRTATKQPAAEERKAFLTAVRSVLDSEARKLAGDPGVVLPRRLSNAEYDHAIRDLTGIDIRPTRTFPVDPAAGEGFNNTGEALTMSPGLFTKLYSAAQHVADHALLTTDGLDFAPYPVETFADRTKFYEQAIIRFYERHSVNYETYLTACREFQHRPSDKANLTIEQWAEQRQLSPKYLSALHEMLNGPPEEDRFYVGWLRGQWRALLTSTGKQEPPTNENGLSSEVRTAIQRLAREITQLSQQITPKETEAIVSNAGNGPVFHLDRRRKTAAERDAFEPKSLQATRRLHLSLKNLPSRSSVRISIAIAAPASGNAVQDEQALIIGPVFSPLPFDKFKADDKGNLPLKKLLTEFAPDQTDRIADDKTIVTASRPLEIELPIAAFAGAKEIHFYANAELDRSQTKTGCLAISLSESDAAGKSNESTPRPNPLTTLLVDPSHPIVQQISKSGAAFCQLFPNRFYYVDDPRGLSAGFHLIEGFFRDDQPLRKHVLSDAENLELDRLWTELEFVTGITEKMLRGFVFFERSERNFLKHADFNPFKEEDPKLIEMDVLHQFERVYLDRSNVKQPVEELTSHPIHIFFEDVRNGLRRRTEQLRIAEPLYLRDLETFARQAYRRPLTQQETDNLRTFYRQVASQNDLGVEQAVRASLIRILMSPYFGCRIVPSPDGQTVKPLDDLELASRLSFFLWASGPDEELMSLAVAGKLRDDQTLLAQTRRMLKDEKVAGFAQEFFGQWLGYRDFDQKESVDRNVFREFDEPLKQAMFEEPTRLASHLIRNDLPVTQLLDSNMTFVNGRLARHYGLSAKGEPDDWTMADGLASQGRGGLLGMAVFLTANSQPQRTSPVKRGFWVVHKVLGEHIPAPPADVVALPAKETDTNGKTIRELLALHVEDSKCARCHVRFDSVGLSMEGFDPIGRRRTKDLAGRPVDDVVSLSDGNEARGVPDFARYLVRNRRDDYVRTLSRKMLGYALGRSLLLSDEVLLEEMRSALDKNGDRFVPLFESIVLSPQFRTQRCRDFSVARFREERAK